MQKKRKQKQLSKEEQIDKKLESCSVVSGSNDQSTEPHTGKHLIERTI